MKAKQVIVMRTDLNMRRGKQIAQGSHASLGVILNMMSKSSSVRFETNSYIPYTNYSLCFDNDTPFDKWLNGTFTKICVGVNSEEELINLYETAKENNLPCILITDAGLTEFAGVPTKTCIAIGPDWSDKIDAITGHLKLL